MPDFTNKLCIITGAASGIGRATATKMASHGSVLALSDINMKGLQETKELCKDSEKHSIEILDVGSSSAVNGYIEKLGRNVDFVFNCNPTAYELTETTDEYWDKLTNTNLRGTYNMTRACIPHMTSGSSFVNVSSIMGTGVAPRFAIYCATKWGIVGFTKAMALELGPKNIRINAVAPGYIDTPTNAAVVAGAEAVKEEENRVALGRLGTPEEIADVVAFLFSNEARYVTGSVIEIHGGRMA
ncbi:uncharacterized protein MYCFIDRAFT_127934 [Pseudocercospora fijiensis CIRAD86]|uniref:Uncharacterized protein n=1 Tax=Pseudocercospora fijiensis (strain CIRAD86) TaxID=383855 RepID=N1Q696_PSEFD|nr:uncharacterized protein MYCFIDRAFT_127934 [Pseudocercospora fijiensis CIRAD86]EME87759.1 hypothetical protein MYCFIDRAFT_127934 [Pseudocercospora fijiensis CIRAD86]